MEKKESVKTVDLSSLATKKKAAPAKKTTAKKASTKKAAVKKEEKPAESKSVPVNAEPVVEKKEEAPKYKRLPEDDFPVYLL